MTKLAPIKEFTKFGMREHRGLTVFNDVELELARQAIISDFVSKLNVAMTTSAYTDDYGVFHPSAKLYALPEWKEK